VNGPTRLRPTYPIETARLQLRPFCGGDYDAVLDLQSRPEVARREAHFVRNEFIKDQWAEEFVYALLEDEWQRAHAA
jgi:hypothetical protein